MGDFRISYGRALGQLNNFYARTDGLAAQADTTPDVTNIGLLYTNNTSTTAITYFDLSSPQGSGNVGWFEGKELTVLFLDDSTSLTRSSVMATKGDESRMTANTVVNFLYHNSAWLETSRSVNVTNIVTVESKNLYTVAAGTGGVNVQGINVVRIVAGAGSNAIIRTAVNGYPGQILTLVASGVSDALIVVNSASNIDGTFATTTSGSTATQFRLMSSGAISFVKTGNRWLEIRPVSGNSSGDLQ